MVNPHREGEARALQVVYALQLTDRASGKSFPPIADDGVIPGQRHQLYVPLYATLPLAQRAAQNQFPALSLNWTADGSAHVAETATAIVIIHALPVHDS